MTTKTVTAATVSPAAPSGSAPAANKHPARTDSAETTRLATNPSLPTRRSTTWQTQIADFPVMPGADRTSSEARDGVICRVYVDQWVEVF
jgi:hypothetical protein